MRPRDQLQALGYGADSAEIQRFQRDYNAMPPKRALMITGRLDSSTIVALATAHEAGEMFVLMREQRGL